MHTWGKYGKSTNVFGKKRWIVQDMMQTFEKSKKTWMMQGHTAELEKCWKLNIGLLRSGISFNFVWTPFKVYLIFNSQVPGF
jgi:hypothetical protein